MMSLELELKFLLGPADAATLSELLMVYGEVKTRPATALLNAYFDTSAQWFRHRDMGLRTRQKHGRFEQTIKLAGQQHGALQARPEYNVSCSGVVPELGTFPPEIWPVDTDVVALQAALLELFRTDFNRQSWLLKTANAEIDVVYDQGEVRSGQRRQQLAELELELISGDVSELFQLAGFLLEHLPLRAGWLSKAARGYQLYHQKTTPRPAVIEADLAPNRRLLRHLQRLQQLEVCYTQELAAELLVDAADELQELANILQDDGEQLLATQARVLQRQLVEQQGLLFNSRSYQQWLLAISALLLQRH